MASQPGTVRNPLSTVSLGAIRGYSGLFGPKKLVRREIAPEPASQSSQIQAKNVAQGPRPLVGQGRVDQTQSNQIKVLPRYSHRGNPASILRLLTLRACITFRV